MQLFTDQPKYYAVLLFPLVVFLFGNNSIIHVVILSVFCLLFASGTYFKNYCNMATMFILFPILIFQNLYCTVKIFEKNSHQNVLNMFEDVSSSLEFWLNFIEAISICCLSYFALRQYWIYRSQFERI